jgi:hypothetical protein
MRSHINPRLRTRRRHIHGQHRTSNRPEPTRQYSDGNAHPQHEAAPQIIRIFQCPSLIRLKRLFHLHGRYLHYASIL